MATTNFYAINDDLTLIQDLFDQSSEVAWLVRSNDGQWRAQQTLGLHIRLGIYKLWHVPSGPVWVINKDREPSLVENPWLGWSGSSIAGDPKVPMFRNGGQPGIISLVVNNATIRDRSEIRVSYLEWTGNSENAKRGWPVSVVTERYWRRLKSDVNGLGRRVPAGGLFSGSKTSLVALPAAYHALTQA